MHNEISIIALKYIVQFNRL